MPRVLAPPAPPFCMTLEKAEHLLRALGMVAVIEGTIRITRIVGEVLIWREMFNRPFPLGSTENLGAFLLSPIMVLIGLYLVFASPGSVRMLAFKHARIHE